MLVDLDQLDSLDEKLRFFSLNRFNLVSLMSKDFGPRDGSSVAGFIRARATEAGAPDIARIHMLAYPRLLGFAFNPITVYFCEDDRGTVRFMVYEVRNTFGEHHFYQAVIAADATEITHDNPKAFYVSPFNSLAGHYRFAVRPPADNVFLGITLSDDDGGLVTTYFDARRQELTDATLLKLLLAYPLMTVKVVIGIHLGSHAFVAQGCAADAWIAAPAQERASSVAICWIVSANDKNSN